MTNPYGQQVNPYTYQNIPNQQPPAAAPNPFAGQPPAQPQYAYGGPVAGPNGTVPPAPAPEQQWQPQPSAPPANEDTSSFFGGGGAFISFRDRATFNVWRGGQVVSKRLTVQRDDKGQARRWEDGSERKQVVVTLQTNERTDAEDDGRRDLYVKGYMVAAVRDALGKSGARDVEPMGWLYVAWTSEDPSKGKMGNAAKGYSAIYAPPGASDPAPTMLAGQQVGLPTVAAPQQQAAPPAPMPQQYASVDPAVAAAQQQAWMAAQQQAAQPAGPLAAIPQQVMQQAHQAAMTDPAVAAAAGYPPPGQAFQQAVSPEMVAMQQAQAAQPDPAAQQAPPQFSPFAGQQAPGPAPAGFNPFGQQPQQ